VQLTAEEAAAAGDWKISGAMVLTVTLEADSMAGMKADTAERPHRRAEMKRMVFNRGGDEMKGEMELFSATDTFKDIDV